MSEGTAENPSVHNPLRGEVLTELLAVCEKNALGIVTIRNSKILKKYGWKGPRYPQYVSASPGLWQFWLDQATRG